MSDSKVHDEPSMVASEDGIVIVDGPGGITVSFTPQAAIETSDRLLQAGTHAHGHNLQHERDKKTR